MKLKILLQISMRNFVKEKIQQWEEYKKKRVELVLFGLFLIETNNFSLHLILVSLFTIISIILILF